ncbi:MAG: MMPL family transporter [bacterium]|nr:MMPL family transporter [bacterium]MYD04641.1 MMPL family transporter [Acidimicrobiia bacterium]
MIGNLARFCAKRPIVTIGLWVLVALVSLGINDRLIDSALTTELTLAGRYESQRAEALIEERLTGPRPQGELVVIKSSSVRVDDPAFQTKVESLASDIAALGPDKVIVQDHFYLSQNPLLVSPDGQATLMVLTMPGSADTAIENVGEVLHVVEEADHADGFRVLMGGDASVSYENNELALHDLERGERFGIPIALIILLALLGTVVATLLPLGLAGFAIVLALAGVAIVGQLSPLLFFVRLMVVMIGLAVGIDYALLIVSRFKEELARGLSTYDAVIRAAATAGRTVVFSGATVVLALIGLLIIPASFFQSLALGAILVVLFAMAATLTLLPAVLSLLGPRVDKLSVPFLSRFSLKTPEESLEGFWEKVTRRVMRRPVLSILLVAVPMLFLSYFYLDIKTGLNDVNTFPDGIQTKEAFLLFEEKFSVGTVTPAGFISPAEIVIDGDLNDPAVAEAASALRLSLFENPAFPVPPEFMANEANDLALITLSFPGRPNSPAAADLVRVIREQIIPASFEGVPADVYVGGASATLADFQGIVSLYTPIVFALVLGLSFIILMMVFRSIVIPLKAIIMNLLAVGATYGLLVLVFQKGFGTDLFGFQRAEVIDAWMPLFLFAVLFGLSMDYHVFLLSRIRERYDETGDNTEAVAYGLRSTAGIITGAALIMVAVFGGFATGRSVINQLMGFGLAVAVFLDASFVRSILVPASMEVLGARNWYLPPFLRWLPDLKVEAEEGH